MTEEEIRRDVHILTATGWMVVSDTTLGVQLQGPRQTRFFTGLFVFLTPIAGMAGMLFFGLFAGAIAACALVVLAVANQASFAKPVRFLERG